jgi:hypothetical protein
MHIFTRIRHGTKRTRVLHAYFYLPESPHDQNKWNTLKHTPNLLILPLSFVRTAPPKKRVPSLPTRVHPTDQHHKWLDEWPINEFRKHPRNIISAKRDTHSSQPMNPRGSMRTSTPKHTTHFTTNWFHTKWGDAAIDLPLTFNHYL